MKIVHFTYTIKGGAGIVVNRFHHLLIKHGYESAIITIDNDLPDEQILQIKQLKRPFRKLINALRYRAFRLYVRLKYRKSKQHNFTYNYNYRNLRFEEITESIPFKPDIIFLHWISDFLSPEVIKKIQQYYQCPIVWRYNDLAPVSGGCHYLAGCERYQTGCGYCPALGSGKKNDWSSRYWNKKNRIFPKLDITIVNSTHHTEAVFKASPLFRDKLHTFIRNSLPEDVYEYAANKKSYRRLINTDINKKIIFWGATHIIEPRKGFGYFLKALEELQATYKDEWVIIIAGNKPATFNPKIQFEHYFTGLVSTEALINYYQASDLVVCTSVEDGGPMMVVESLLCGTPLVSFDSGLAQELVITGQTGYQAEKFSTIDLATGISYVLNLPAKSYELIQQTCRSKALALYGEKQEINSYRELFSKILNKKNDS